jgi:hypothetical protein
MMRPRSWFPLFVVLALAAGCGGGPVAADSGPPATCAAGAHVLIESDDVAVDLDALATQPVTVAGVEVLAVPLTSVVSDEIVAAWSYNGMLSGDETRALYDWEIAAGDGPGQVIPSESLPSAWFVPADGAVAFSDAAFAPDGWAPVAPCHVRALRRFIVRGVGTTATVYLDDLAAQVETITTSAGAEEAVSIRAIVDASGMLGQDPPGSRDYMLVPPDVPAGVRFPWAHNHVERLYWGTAARKTLSTDTTGDLDAPGGGPIYGGVANAGFSRVKALLYISLMPAPDPAHVATAAGGRQLTDPASCVGCHLENGSVPIPVTCSQCHQ